MSQVAVFSQLLSRALPSELQYTMPQQAVHCDRQTIYFDAVQTTAKPAETTTLHIPPSTTGFMDTHATHLRFKVKRNWRLNSELSDHKIYLPPSGASALLAGYRIKHGPSGVTLEEEEAYNLRVAMMHDITVPEHLSRSVLRKLQGTSYSKPVYTPETTTPSTVPASYQESVEQLVEITKIGEYYQIPLKTLIFGNSKHIPLKYLGGLTLELVWATPYQGAIVYNTPDTSNHAYELSDISLVADMVFPSDIQMAAFDQAFREKGMRLYGSTWHHATDSLRSSIQQVRVPFRSASMKTIFVVPRKDTRVSDPSEWKRVLRERSACVQEYQWSIAGKYLNSRPISNETEALQELVTAMHGHVQGSQFDDWGSLDDTKCRYLIARELESSRTLVSGFDEAKQKTSDILLTLKRSSYIPDGTTIRLDMLVESDCVLEFRPDGSVAIYK